MTQAGFIDASEAPPRATNEIKLHGKDAFEGMRKSGRVSAECLDMLVPYVVPGVTTASWMILPANSCYDHRLDAGLPYSTRAIAIRSARR